jgi:hypothetical protein
MSNLPQQSETHSQVIPRKAIYKTKSSLNNVIEKKELISYPSNSLSQSITVGKDDLNKKIEFHLSGDCMADFKESYFSLKMKTNKYTSYLSSDITSIISKVQISLPSNNNQILESIDNYNGLQSMLFHCNGSEQSYETSWNSGLNSMMNFNKGLGARSARRYMNFESAERVFTFQLNLSGVLSNGNYCPLMLFNGLKIELFLAPASEALFYKPSDEASFDSIFDCVDAPFQKAWGDMDNAEQTFVAQSLSDHLEKPNPPNNKSDLNYSISAPVFWVQTVWMSSNYISQLIKASESASGVLFSYDTYRFNQITPNSPYVNFQYPDALQNIKAVFFGTYLRQKAEDSHFSLCVNALKNFTFRIGSRIFNQVDNDESAFAFTNMMLALGKLGSYHSSALTYTNYQRSKNVQVYDFQNARDESKHTNSGLNSTNGNSLRMELNFHSGVNKTVKSPTDNTTLCTLIKKNGYQDCHVNAFLKFSKHMRINNAGILIVE